MYHFHIPQILCLFLTLNTLIRIQLNNVIGNCNCDIGAVDKGHLDGFMAESAVAPLKNELNSNTMGFATQPMNETTDNSNTVYAVGHYAPKVLRNLNSQRLKNQFSDVGLVVGNTVIRAHRSVLAASSAYFNAMFTGGLVEEQQELVEIHSISENILSILIDFIYTGNVNITQDNVQELFAAADMLELDEVVSSCISYLQEQLHYSNALGIYRYCICKSKLIANFIFTLIIDIM